MASFTEMIRRLLSPEAAERGAESDNVRRAPAGVQERLEAELRRKREEKRTRTGQTAMDRAMRENV